MSSETIAGEKPAPFLTGFFYARMCALLLRRVTLGSLQLHLPDGRVLRATGGLAGPQAAMQIRNWNALRRVLSSGPIGLAEGYLAEEWTSPDLVALLSFLARNESALGRWVIENPLRLWLNRRKHSRNANSPGGSRKNIEAHYDLGNDFYRLWLDRSMNYSSAIYREAGDDTLEAAQHRKMTRIASLLDAGPDTDVLEIGCGWGALAEHLAAGTGCPVTGITLSTEQLDFARTRFSDAGIAHLANADLVDYRAVEGQFDRIVSIEMIEAVGEAWWPTYFGCIADLLKPDGHALIQAITIAPALFENYRTHPDFIQCYIFPGGMLPTLDHIERHAADAGLVVRVEHSFGLDYARTLRDWRDRFQQAWSEISALGYPPSFRRLWEYYLAYCEAGFAIGHTDVHLITLRKR